MISDKEHNLITGIINRLSEHVNYANFVNWLEQFKVEDRLYAIEVASKIRYYSETNILEIYENNQNEITALVDEFHERLTNWANDITYRTSRDTKFKKEHYRKKFKKGFNDILTFPIGIEGKSGSAMSYKYTHTQSYRNSTLFKLDSIHGKINIKENGTIEFPSGKKIRHRNITVDIVLIDDIIGSGGTVVKFIEKSIVPLFKELGVTKLRIHICSIVVLKQSISKMKKFADENDMIISFRTYGEKLDRCFSSKSSVFGYRPRMIPIREMCYKYGDGLYVQQKFKENKRIKVKNPLGHENSQALVVFSHSTPNNTLPIIWSNAKGWIPLVARSSTARIDRLKSLRKDMYLWLSIANSLQLDHILDKKGDLYSTENVRLLCYIKLKKEGNLKETVRLKLNISVQDFGEILEAGIRRKMLHKDGEISEYGVRMYNEITAKVKGKNRYEYTNPDEILYLPTSFRGKV